MFTSWLSYSDFATAVKRSGRRQAMSTKAKTFLNALSSTAASRTARIAKGKVFWRAQRGFSVATFAEDISKHGVPTPHLPARMKPPPIAAAPGRLTRKGESSCLYLATDEHTAIAEIRPWIGNHVSVAQFKLLRDVQIIDCSSEHSEDYWFYESEPEDPIERERAVWHELSRCLSEPIDASTRTTEYKPTQIIGDHFRALGLDGIMYQSILGGGRNVALFDGANADPGSCALVYVRCLLPLYDEVAAPCPSHSR